MRVRNHRIAAVIVASIALSGANVAWAQGSQPPPTARAPAPSASARRVSAAPAAPVTPAANASAAGRGVEPLFAPPAVLDQAWARAVRAVLDGVKRLMDAERVEATEALGGAPIPPVDHDRVTQVAPPLRFVPAWRAAWTPAKAVREALATAPMQPTPLPIEPPTEADTDTRGEHAVLLGATMTLPWLVP